MTKLQERIKERRIALNLTLLDVANLIGVKEATAQRYESGEIKNIKHETIVELAKIFKCSPQYLMGWSDKLNEPLDDNVSALPTDHVFMRPLYNSVAAGFGVPAVNQIVSYIPTYINNVFEKDKYIWVRVEGDSMFPKIEDGDKILIRLQESVDSGQIGVVLIDGEEAVVKKINYGDNWIELESFNPYYPPRRFEGSDVQQIRVVGLVREVSKELQ